MLEKKMTTFEVEGRKIPIICTFNVLVYVQEAYGTIFEFQKQVLGLTSKEDTDKEGKEQFCSGTINIKAVLDGATVMINEGLSITESGECLSVEDVGVLLTAAGMSIATAAGLVFEELIKCIEPKKEGAVQSLVEKKTPKSTLRGFFTSAKRFFTIRKKR